MAVFENRHSRRVALLKVALPLIALAILSTLFLVADRRGTGDSVPFSSVEMDRIITEQQVSGPNYASVTDDGSALTITAKTVAPGTDAATAGLARDLIVVIEDESGVRLDLSAQTGTLESDMGQARLEGDVALRSSSGYRLAGAAFDVRQGPQQVVSDGPVRGSGPPGTLVAGKMNVTRRDGDYVLNFTDGVNLIYDPTTQNGR